MFKHIRTLLGMGVLLFSSYGSMAQELTSSEWNALLGTVLNEEQHPIDLATLSLFQGATFVKSTITTPEGTFRIPNIDPGTYVLQIDHMEYETYRSQPFAIAENEVKTLPTITLKRVTNSLEEVVITKKKEIIEVKPDKVVFNVSSSPSASGSNGLDVLRQAPGVTIDLDNSINLLGKSNVQVYLNGVQSRLSGADLVNFLQSLSSDVIDSIEIITNPSSKYDAEGTGGIIDIRLKKAVSTGFNGNATSSFTKGEKYRYNNNLSLNYGLGKWKFNLDATQSYNNYPERFDDRKIQNNVYLKLYSRDFQIRKGWNLGLGAEAQLNDNHYVGLSTRGIFNTTNNELNSWTNIYQNDPFEFQQLLVSQSIRDGNSSNILGNAFHLWTLSDSANLTTNVSAGSYDSTSDTFQPNTYFAPDGVTIIEKNDTAFDSDTQINLWSAKTDYEKSWESITLTAGVKYAHVKTQNTFAFFNFENGQPIFDNTKSNDFNYTENVTAGYVNLNWNLGEQWIANGGFRVENTSSRGQLLSDVDIENKDVKRNYTDYFPNFGLTYKWNEDNTLSANLGRRITRPNYQDLNPFEYPNSQLVVWKGNPFLNPNYVMNYQMSYAYKSKFLLTLFYSKTTDFFARIVEITGDESSQIIPRNMQKSYNYGASSSFSFDVIQNTWNVLLFGNASIQKFDGDVEGTVIDLTAWLWNYRIQNNLKLPWDITMDVSFYQQSKWIWRGSVYISGTYNLDFGVRKDFFNKKLQLRITGNDILGTSVYYPYTSDYGGINLDGNYIGDGMRFGAGLTYNFGEASKSKRKTKSALQEELDRIDN